MRAILGGARNRLRTRGRDADGAGEAEPSPAALPDPSKPPEYRGDWERAALTNVDITELVKREIRTVTRPWQK